MDNIQIRKAVEQDREDDEKNQTGIIVLAKKQYRKTAYLNLLSFRYAVCVY